MTYPPHWPRCPSCGDFALDGHITCGPAEWEPPLKMTDDVRSLLAHRSVRDKIAVGIDNGDSGTRATVATLVLLGYLEWMEQAEIPHIVHSDTLKPLTADIYKLTSRGIALCEFHGIKQL